MLEDRTTEASSPTVWPAAYPRGYAVVDVETTGLARDDRIISAAVYRLDARGEVEDHWYTLVNPERDPGPVWIHGLTSEVLDGAPLFRDIAEEFAARLDGRVLVAHNAVFDWQMIAREYARAEREAPVRQRLCTIALAKELALPLPNHKLESLAARRHPDSWRPSASGPRARKEPAATRGPGQRHRAGAGRRRRQGGRHRTGRRAAEAAAALGPDAVGVAADNADPEAAARLIATARERFGPLRRDLRQRGRSAAGLRRRQHRRPVADGVRVGLPRRGAPGPGGCGGVGGGGVIGFVLSGSVHEPIPGLTVSNGLRPGLAGFAKRLLRTSWGRGDSGSSDCCRPVSTRIACGSWTGCRLILRPPGLRTSPGFRRGGTGRRRSSAGRRRFCCRRLLRYLTGIMLPVDGGMRHGF
ncbi:3'-5' exonuclease DinG [Streptomyces fumanus]